MGRRVDFNTPERRRPRRDSFDARPRQVAQWLDGLPRANAGETARRIFKVLTETNGLRLRCRHRVNLLENLREPVQFVLEQMQRHFVGEPAPLPPRKRQIAIAAHKLTLAMATGYKIAAEDLVAESILFLDRRHLAVLLHRAVTYLTRALLIAYQTYTEFPQQPWSDLYRLYRFAESRRLHRVAVADEQHQYIVKTTVEQEFARALLLYLSSPYQLRQGEVGKVHVNLERWLSAIRLQPTAGEGDKGFIVNLAGDAPPQPIHMRGDDCNPADCRLLSTAGVVAALRKELERDAGRVSSTLITMGMEEAALPHDLLHRLIQAWETPAVERPLRTDLNEPVKAAVGLTAVHHFLLHQQPGAETENALEDLINGRARFDTRAEREQEVDVWELAYAPRGPVTGIEVAGEKPEPAVPECRLGDWVVVNESAGGLQLACAGQCATRVQVGELMAVRRETAAGTGWVVGMVRWMKAGDDGGVEVGLLLLAPAAVAVGVTMAVQRQDGGGRRFDRALLVPASVANRHQAALITVPYPYRPGAVVTVLVQGQETRVKLAREVDNTGLCAIFHFTPLNRPARAGGPPDEFDEVWNLL